MTKSGASPRLNIALSLLIAATTTLTLTRCSSASEGVSVTTYHYDNMRSGVQAKETILTPSNVLSGSFGKLFTLTVDGQVYAQPLIVAKLQMSDGISHDVLFIATEHDTVYAFDADNASTQPFWSTSLLAAGETTVPAGDTGSQDVSPEIGISGTPVIDPQQGVLYVVAKSKAIVNGQATYSQRLHALGLLDGKEMLNGPTLINASLAGNAVGAVNGIATFDQLRSHQRSALALINGTVWVAFASHGDQGIYHGWLLGYNSTDISQQTQLFDNTPNGWLGGIWMAANGPSTDSSGDIYLTAGNGDYDATKSNYGASSVRLRPGITTPNGTVKVIDSFTPSDKDYENSYDWDMGVMGSVILPDQTGPIPHLLITADKLGETYVINRDNFGGYDPMANHVVQTFLAGPNNLHQNGVFFNNTLYFSSDNAPMYAYTFNPTTEQFMTTPSSATAQVYMCTGCYVGGSAPTISANGTSNGILWTIDATSFNVPGPGILHAYDPTDLTHELYNSTQSTGDQAPNAIKFTTPVVANGRVYVGANGAVAVYGLLNN